MLATELSQPASNRRRPGCGIRQVVNTRRSQPTDLSCVRRTCQRFSERHPSTGPPSHGVASTALAHLFDTGHVTGVEYSNVVKPGRVPMGGMGAIPVIARLVCADGAEEWWPARAVRWTEDAVLVGYESSPGDQNSLRHLWLGIDDVARVIRPPVTRDP